MWYQDAGQEDAEVAKGGVTSKSLVRYTEPFDIRHSGYLILTRSDDVNDQFVYMAAYGAKLAAKNALNGDSTVMIGEPGSLKPRTTGVVGTNVVSAVASANAIVAL